MYDTTCVWPLEFSSGGTGVYKRTRVMTLGRSDINNSTHTLALTNYSDTTHNRLWTKTSNHKLQPPPKTTNNTQAQVVSKALLIPKAPAHVSYTRTVIPKHEGVHVPTNTHAIPHSEEYNIVYCSSHNAQNVTRVSIFWQILITTCFNLENVLLITAEHTQPTYTLLMYNSIQKHAILTHQNRSVFTCTSKTSPPVHCEHIEITSEKKLLKLLLLKNKYATCSQSLSLLAPSSCAQPHGLRHEFITIVTKL